MKRILTLIIAASMLILAFAGCSSDDIALYSAIMKQPESCVITTTAKYDIQLEEAFMLNDEYFDDEMKAQNYFINVMSGLLSAPELVSVVTKSGNDMRQDISVSYPDSSKRFTLWGSVDPANPMEAEYTMLIPSYVRPFLPVNMKDKRYASFNMQEYMQLISSLTGAYNVGVIGGADGPTSVFVVQQPQLAINEAITEQALKFIDAELVSGVAKSAGDTIYTIKLDSAALTKLVDGIIKTLSKDEVGNLIGAIASMSGAEKSGSEIALELKEGVAYADLIDGLICDKLAQTGLFSDGVTVKYTVDRNGYVVKTETDVMLNIDIEKIYKAIVEIVAAVSGEEPEASDVEIKGKMHYGIKAVSEITRINEGVDPMMPVLTEENNINIAKDIAEYAQYSREKSSWEYSWYSYSEMREYLEALEEGQTLVLHNDDNGREVTVEPKEIDGELCVPATELAKLFDGISVEWNSELMGVEITYSDGRTILYTNNGGAVKYSSIVGDENTEVRDDTYYIHYGKYGFVNRYFCDNFDENGKFYIDVDMFNYSFPDNYRARFENGKYCFASYDGRKFQYYKSMDGNLIYEFEKIFEY